MKSPHPIKNEQGVQPPPVRTQSDIGRRHSEYSPANDINELRRASSAARLSVNTQLVPSPGAFQHHQSPSEEMPYQYDTYPGSANAYQAPFHPHEGYVYNPHASPSSYGPAQAGQLDSSNEWQYAGMQTDYAANTLMAMHQGGPHAGQQHSPHSDDMMAYMAAIPNLVPGGTDAGGMPDELWPDATWIAPDERRRH